MEFSERSKHNMSSVFGLPGISDFGLRQLSITMVPRVQENSFLVRESRASRS